MEPSFEQLMGIGLLGGVTALVRILVLLNRAAYSNPHEMALALKELGFPPEPTESALLIVGYQYTLLRRRIPQLEGSRLESERASIGLWYVLFIAGAMLIVLFFLGQALQ
jgi:hypothetical protein